MDGIDTLVQSVWHLSREEYEQTVHPWRANGIILSNFSWDRQALSSVTIGTNERETNHLIDFCVDHQAKTLSVYTQLPLLGLLAEERITDVERRGKPAYYVFLPERGGRAAWAGYVHPGSMPDDEQEISQLLRGMRLVRQPRLHILYFSFPADPNIAPHLQYFCKSLEFYVLVAGEANDA